MLFKSQGIIFRKINYSETSLILDIFTQENGLQSFIISGIRKARSQTNIGVFRECSIIDIVAYQKSGNSLSRIKEAKRNVIYQHLDSDVIRSSIAIFILEVARNAIKEKSKNDKLFQFLKTSFLELDQTQGSFSNFHLYFMVKLATEIGIEVQNNFSDQNSYFHLGEGSFKKESEDQYCMNAELSLLIHQLINMNQEEILEFKLSSAERNQLLEALISYYQYHIDGFGPIKSLDVFRTVLA